MKYLLLIFTLLLSSPSWGESVSSDALVKNPTDGLVYKKFTSDPFTGSTTPTTDHPSKGSFKNGKKHGLYEEYYGNGLLRYKGTYKDGNRNLTTKASLKRRIMTDYWNHHGPEDEGMRKDLGLD